MKYFKLEEFDSPDLKGSGKNMKKDFLVKLDEARELAGIPFKINSGFRTKAQNLKAKGASKSSHLIGVAADISCRDSVSRQIIVNALITVGFTRLGIANSFIHVDLDINKPDAVWLY